MSPAERWRATVVAVTRRGTLVAAAAPGQLQLWHAGRPPAPAAVCASEYPPPRPRGPEPRFSRAWRQLLRRRGETPPMAAGFADYRADLALARAQLREQLAYVAAHALDSWSDQ
jgi:hypothetical protein